MGTTHSSVSSSSNSRRARVVAVPAPAPATTETADREVIQNDIPLEVVIRPMPEEYQEEVQQAAAETNTTSSRRRQRHGSRRNHRHSHRHNRGTTATSREYVDELSFDGRPPPPASNRILQSLTRHHLTTQEDVNAMFKGVDMDEEECLICSEILPSVGNTVTKLPCGHVFHSTCIVDGWLSKHCTCPTCRYELPTDSAKYEYGRFDRMRTRKIQYLMEKHNLKISTYVCMNPDINETTIDSNENHVSEISSATTTTSSSSSNITEMDSCGEAAVCKNLVQVSSNNDTDSSFLWMRDY